MPGIDGSPPLRPCQAVLPHAMVVCDTTSAHVLHITPLPPVAVYDAFFHFCVSDKHASPPAPLSVIIACIAAHIVCCLCSLPETWTCLPRQAVL